MATKRYDEGGYAESEDSKYDMPAPSSSMAEATEFAAEKKQTFKEAFAAARRSGAKTFEYNGKKYTTELASSKSEKPAARKSESAKTSAAKSEPAEKSATRTTSLPPDSLLGKIAKSQGATSDFPKEGSPTGAKAARQQKEFSDTLDRTGNNFLRYMGTQATRDRLKAEGYAKGGTAKGWGKARGARAAKVY